jgi:hypothetical protein
MRQWTNRSTVALVTSAMTCVLLPNMLRAQGADISPRTKTLAEVVVGLDRQDGIVPIYVDPKGGRILAELPAPTADGVLGRYLYQVSLRVGLGSATVGLDRSLQTDPTKILVFRRVGKRVLAEYENPMFRAASGTPDEQQAVRESFAKSTVWGGDILAEGQSGPLLVDLSGFLTRDVVNFPSFLQNESLSDKQKAVFKLEPNLSYPDVTTAQDFPENAEFDAMETFTSDKPGDEISAIVPEPRMVSIVVHHSLIRLPGPGYRPRLFDPRTGTIDWLGPFADYSAPPNEAITYRFATRFRLEKTDSMAPRSPVKKPITFYVDKAAPEPMRSAIIQGIKWWSQAFDEAGFINAIDVQLLPENVSALDTRYNVIGWVHRQTRGFSFGQTIVDPRTGEVVRGSVRLGSLRFRQDRQIFEGLIGADKTGSGLGDDPIIISLARLRQLAVHETGHTLGLAHNFAGSTFDDRASVMDYPAPRIKIKDGKLDFSDVYKIGLGSWDKFAIKWLYSDAPPGAAEKLFLDSIVNEAYARGMRFVANDEGNALDSAQPYGNTWDDGPDAVAALQQVLNIRQIALAHFGLHNLLAGAPVSDLKRVLVPIYLFHRYEVVATVKLIGGIDFPYAVNGDGHEASRPVPGAEQRRALKAALATLDPVQLDLPTSLINLLSSAQTGTPDLQYTREVFGDAADPVFNLPLAADTAADITLKSLFQPARLNRIVDQSTRDASQLNLEEVLKKTIAVVFATPTESDHSAELQRRVRARFLIDIAKAQQDNKLSPTAAAVIKSSLAKLGHTLASQKKGNAADLATSAYFSDIILKDGLKSLVDNDTARGIKTPPGPPIGTGEEDCWFCEGVSIGNR